MDDYYIHAIPIWELAFYISVTLNRILKSILCYRNGVICSSPEIQPEEILKKASGDGKTGILLQKVGDE